jgi:hypothetical protein
MSSSTMAPMVALIIVLTIPKAKLDALVAMER